MAATDSEMISSGEVVESSLQSDQQPKANTFPSLGRQSSIYSLTLDEFQHTLCDSGKNFGSMNMDEFLTSIWNAEENQAAAAAAAAAAVAAITNSAGIVRGNQSLGNAFPGDNRGIKKQPSLSRQGSLTLPPPLCRKTVDEVWSEIHGGQELGQGHRNGGNGVQNPEPTPRQPIFGEMTLEDFLVKAGVVREQFNVHPMPPQQPPYGMYQTNNNSTNVATGFVSRPGVGVSYQTVPQGGGAIGESSGRSGGYPPAPSPGRTQGATVYGGRVGNGGGYGQAMGVVGPVSPVSSDGMVANVDNVANQYGMDIGGLRGRKRIIDRPVEKVVERRQRRMIKNRESAARSRARKQAYTVELEAELNQLKEENKQLKHALAELERKRKQQSFEELRTKSQNKAQKAEDKLRVMARNLSCPL
ncbi:hypothetical protein K2173_018554 [Erythroxylum novogranatense]|uniref:BZIP domain-containing protein n=1 Tax=Erythroxylum novogranatense TaxID=1862640 RepID=A0AAV8UAR9_9ROSI|nr:hypothetical protein K2173_018554 [Erythroxylum novogranatense]